MKNILRLMAVIMLFGSTIGVAFGATVGFDKTIDVPDRNFNVNYEGSTFSFTIDNLGNYKFGDSLGVTVNGGVNRMRLVIWSVDRLSAWSESYESPGGYISTTIPADRFDPSCLGVCNDDKMGPGIYAVTVLDLTTKKYFIAKPFIISEYDLTVTPDKTRVEPGSSINVTVKISNSSSLVNVSNNVKVEFVQDSKSFGTDATKVSTGTYEVNVPIPYTATGTYLLYAAITTNEYIYDDYPEIMGAGGYSGNILITNSASTPTTPSSGGSGGSGGGGGGLSGEDYSNIEVKEKYELDILNNKITSYRFKNASNPINFINITGNISAGATTTSVEVLKNTSSLVNTPAPGLVYKNMNIWVGTSGFAVPRNIKNATIVFRVDNSWITNRGISGKDVKLSKWDGSKWIKLETRELEKKDAYTIYEGVTDSFSPFAITSLQEEVIPDSTLSTNRTELSVKPAVSVMNAATATPEKETPGFEAIIAVAAYLYIATRKTK